MDVDDDSPPRGGKESPTLDPEHRDAFFNPRFQTLDFPEQPGASAGSTPAKSRDTTQRTDAKLEEIEIVPSSSGATQGTRRSPRTKTREPMYDETSFVCERLVAQVERDARRQRGRHAAGTSAGTSAGPPDYDYDDDEMTDLQAKSARKLSQDKEKKAKRKKKAPAESAQGAAGPSAPLLGTHMEDSGAEYDFDDDEMTDRQARAEIVKELDTRSILPNIRRISLDDTILEDCPTPSDGDTSDEEWKKLNAAGIINPLFDPTLEIENFTAEPDLGAPREC